MARLFPFESTLILLIVILFLFACKKKGIDPIPIAPSNLVATGISTSSIALSWQDQSTNETSFKIERKVNAGNFQEIATVNADITVFSDAGLLKATNYTYRVYALNAAGKSLSYTNEASATTFDDIPSTSNDLQALAIAKDKIQLSWSDIATNESGYKIERKNQSGTFELVSSLQANASGFTDQNLLNNSIYTYRVFPFNSSGNGKYSNEASDTTFPDLESGLILYFPFTGNATDSSGNSRNAVVNGASLTTDRRNQLNKAYSFGLNSNITVPSLTLGGGDLTLFFFFYPENLPALQRLVTHDWTNGGTLTTAYINNGFVSTNLKDGFDTQTTSPTSSPLNGWYSCAVVRTGNTYELYLDGNKVSSVQCGTPAVTTKTLFIGGDNFNPFWGKIDEVRLYNKALSSYQIKFLNDH